MPSGAILLGSKSAGGKPGSMAISWWISPADYQTLGQTPDLVSNPTFPFLSNQTLGSSIGSTLWQQYLLDPQKVQSASDFGIAKSLGLTIIRQVPYFSSATVYYVPGRILVKVTATGQIHTFGPKDPIGPVTGVVPQFLETYSTIIPIWSLTYAPIEIWFEPDSVDQANTPSLSLVYATLYNFDLHAPGVL